MDIHRLPKNYATISEVWADYPNGGNEGDYFYLTSSPYPATPENTKHRWNKYAQVWEIADVVIDESARETTTFSDLHVHNDLHVGGVVVAGSIKSLDKGIFESVAELNAAYPHPDKGWYAAVVNTSTTPSSLVVYLSKLVNGVYVWTATGAAPIYSIATTDEINAWLTQVASAFDLNNRVFDLDGRKLRYIFDTYVFAADAQLRIDVDSKYQKPSGGVPVSDLESFITCDVDANAILGPQSDAVKFAIQHVREQLSQQHSKYVFIPSGGGAFLGVGATTGGEFNLSFVYAKSLVYVTADSSDNYTVSTYAVDAIPKTQLASTVQTSLGKADTAYQKPSGGVPKSDLASTVQTSLGKADTAYQKPSGGVPVSDLESFYVCPVSVSDILGPQSTTVKSAIVTMRNQLVGIHKYVYIPDADLTGPSLGVVSLNGSYFELSFIRGKSLVCVTADPYNNYTVSTYVIDQIAKTQLASAVQTSLGKADTAVQPGDLPAVITAEEMDACLTS